MHFRRIAFVASCAAALLAPVTPVLAHVGVNPNEAPKGGRTKIAFRVPSETEGVATVRFEVTVPTDPPIQSVRTRAIPGWKITTEKAHLATPIEANGRQITEVVSRIVWEGRIEGGQFEEFEVTLGPLPKTDKVVFKAVQTMSNGEVVNWIDEAVAGQAEPEHPAPVVTLTDAKDDHGHGAAPTKNIASTTEDADNTPAYVAGAIALMALLLAGGSLLRGRRSAT